MADTCETGRRDRAYLVKFNIEKIEQGYLQAVQAGEERPVMLIIDLRVKMAFELASHLDPENVKKVRDECNERDVIPTAILATSLPTAVKVIGFMTPSGSETLRQPLASESSWG